jgi:hypothetical protein
VIIVSVVSMSPAIDAAFWRATRATFVGSTMPSLNMSTNSCVFALKPIVAGFSFTSSTITEPSRPVFSAIWRSGASSARAMMRAPWRSSPRSLRSRTAGIARR